MTLASGAMFYSSVEGWSLLDSLYFSVITLTTVGYGDLYPSTTAGKIFATIYLFVDISLILGFLNTIAERSIEQNCGIPRLIAAARKKRIQSARETTRLPAYEARGCGPTVGTETHLRESASSTAWS